MKKHRVKFTDPCKFRFGLKWLMCERGGDGVTTLWLSRELRSRPEAEVEAALEAALESYDALRDAPLQRVS